MKNACLGLLVLLTGLLHAVPTAAGAEGVRRAHLAVNKTHDGGTCRIDVLAKRGPERGKYISLSGNVIGVAEKWQGDKLMVTARCRLRPTPAQRNAIVDGRPERRDAAACQIEDSDPRGTGQGKRMTNGEGEFLARHSTFGLTCTYRSQPEVVIAKLKQSLGQKERALEADKRRHAEHDERCRRGDRPACAGRDVLKKNIANRQKDIGRLRTRIAHLQRRAEGAPSQEEDQRPSLGAGE